MKKLLGILALSFLWSNVGIAAEREPGTDKKCFYQFEKAKVFERKFLPKVNKGKGVFVTYVGCNKYYDDWSWDYSFNAAGYQAIDAAHKKAYNGCLREMDQYNLTGCHLFSIDDVIVWGKDAAFVAKVEKEVEAKLTTKVAEKKKIPKKQSVNAEKLNQNCIRKGTTEFNKNIKPYVKKKFALLMYFHCKGEHDWHWSAGYDADYDKANEEGYNNCFSEKNIACHLFSINDKIVYGEDAAFVAKVKERVKKRLANIAERREKSGAGFYVYKFALYETDQKNVFTKKSPTTFKKITFKEENSYSGIAKAETFAEVKKNNKKTFRSFTFTAEYEDNMTIEIFIEYHKGAKNFERAEYLASYYANMFGQMPHFLKVYTDKMYVHKDIGKDDGVWWATGSKREFHINRSRCFDNSAFVYSRCAVTMMHELAHILQQLTGIISPGKWNKARKLDKNYCSDYAKTNSREDFAESVMCWVAVRHKPNTLKKEDIKKIKEYLANRFKFFDELNWNVYPL